LISDAANQQHDSGNTDRDSIQDDVYDLAQDVMWRLLEGRCFGKVWDVDEDLQNECKSVQMEDILQHMQSDFSVM